MDSVRHPWILGNLLISARALLQIEEEAVACYLRREEACGYLTGPASAPLVVEHAVVMQNLANRYHELDPVAYPRGAETSFLLDGRRFQRAIDEGIANEHPVKVLWHSHLDVGAYFSETDAAAALLGGDEPAHELAYLVLSVRELRVDERALFIWNSSTRSFDKASFRITPPTETPSTMPPANEAS